MISITNLLRIFVVWTQFAAFLRQASRPLMCPDAFVFFVQGIPRNFLLQKRTPPVKNDVLENSYLSITFGLLLCLLLCVVSLKSLHA